jgi:hypothetical protein
MPFKKPGLTINPEGLGLTINTGPESNLDDPYMVKKTTEESIFNDTKQKIIDKINDYKNNDYKGWCKMNGYDEEKTDEEKPDKLVDQINYIIIHMDENNADEFVLDTLNNNECKHQDNINIRQRGRVLSTGCAHAIALYYHCKDTITGIKTYTLKKGKYIIDNSAPLKAGDVKGNELKHYNECKYKIAREIMLQIYANAVSKLRDGLFYVPEIKSFGFIPTEDSNTDTDTENINEKKYFIKMEHIEGEIVYDLTDKKSKLEEVVEYLHNEFQIQHRDIKYNNIYWNGDIPTLIDWGEATCDDEDLDRWDHILIERGFWSSPRSSPGAFGGYIRQKRKTQKNKKRKSQKSKKRKSHKNKKRKSHKNKKRKSHKKK